MDYASLSSSRSSLQSALDSAILSAGKTALSTGGPVDKALMITEIKANLPEHLKSIADNVEITQTATGLSVQLSGSVTNSFGTFYGNPRSSIAAYASVEFGAAATRLEIALVLDSTTSMERQNRMIELKKAALQLIDSLAANRQPGQELAVGVVPFAVQVRVDKSNALQPWITLRPDPGWPHVPSPKDVIDDWIQPEHTKIATWDGCIMDRDRPLNISSSLPNITRDTEKYPAQNCRSKKLQPILPLTTNFDLARQTISALEPGGATNTVIGMVWGLNILNPSAPLGQGKASNDTKKTKRFIVFLTDGDNTADRFGGRFDLNFENRPRIDSNMREICKEAKTTDVRIYTVRLMEGNDALLRECATKPNDFYPVENASELSAVFQSIGGKIRQLRLSS